MLCKNMCIIKEKYLVMVTVRGFRSFMYISMDSKQKSTTLLLVHVNFQNFPKNNNVKGRAMNHMPEPNKITAELRFVLLHFIPLMTNFTT